MQVYSSPIDFEHDFGNYDNDAEEAKIEAHKAQVKDWLVTNGYTGKNTGKIVSFGVADGSAQYMLAEGRKSALVHLPYWDAYQYRDAKFIPKAEILRRIKMEENYAKATAARQKGAK
jgi:hypothetical protein